MIIRVTAAAVVASLGLLAASCSKPAETSPMPDQPARPAPDAFAAAANFECEGGGKVDVVFEGGSLPSALARIDGGEPLKLALDETATSGMVYKNANVGIAMETDRLQLTSGGATRACTFVARSLPAPTVEGVARNLTAEDAGAAVEVKVGEKISVSLSGVPTAGYMWAAETTPGFVKVSDGPGGATSTSQFLPGFAGGNHWEVLIIEAVAPGEGELTLVQKRPWEDRADPADQRFKFKLTAR